MHDGRTTLALAQMLVEPAEPARNLERAAQRVAAAAEAGAQLVLLPEALDCGWTHPCANELAGEIPGGRACEQLRNAAAQHGIMLCAGIIERQGDRLFNSALLISSTGAILLHHRKINELDFARSLYARGDRLAVVDTTLGRIGLMICADAFVEGLTISRTLGQMGATLILSPCAWAVPPHRDLTAEPYGALWRESYGPPAREFQLTIAGCSNVGPVTAGEWSGWHCIGNSIITGPRGETIAEAPSGRQCDTILYHPLELEFTTERPS